MPHPVVVEHDPGEEFRGALIISRVIKSTPETFHLSFCSGV
jgi:hypothetical protein